ncbi:MAG: hypothetical protein JOS17DRAFT_356609 [Linnemannia elongata]|nr:MAG: hypothetical protein JOS17DRAFT_356609 [Linnemannia elongata]
MAFSSSESASIEITSSRTHIILLEGHHTLSPKSTNMDHAIQSGEGEVERVENLCRVSSEKSLRQPPVQSADTPILSGSNSENLNQPSSIAPISLDWDEEGTIRDLAPHMNSSPENDHLVQVELLLGSAVQNDKVLQPCAMAAQLLKNYSSAESGDLLCHYRGTTSLPQPESFPPIYQARGVSNIEIHLESFQRKILSGCSVPYIPLRVKSNLLGFDEGSVLLQKKARNFLESDRRVFLLLGDSGSGKSTSLKQLHRELWTNYKPGDRIPLFIDLPFIDRPEQGLIEKQLLQHNFLDCTVQELLDHRQFIILCDGYDECGLITNLYTTNRLSQQDVKMIVSCRSTFLSPDYQGRFLPYGADRYLDNPLELFEEAVIVPLSKIDIESFVTQYVLDQETARPSSDQPSWTVGKFMNTISTIPNMLAFVENPFLLTLALKFLPSLPRDALSNTKAKATRLKLFDDFLKHWIQVNKVRLYRTIRCRKVFATFEILCEPDFESSVTGFLLRLTAALSQHQTRRPVVVTYEHAKDGKTWKAEFFGRKIKSVLLRDASPLSRAGIQYRFIHDSLFAYLRSRLVSGPVAGEEDGSEGDDDDEDDSDGGGDPDDDDEDDSDGGDDPDDYDNGGHDAHGVDKITFHVCGGDFTGESGGPSDGNHDSSGGNDGSLGDSDGSGYNQCSSGNGESSREGKDGSGGDKNNPDKDDSRSKQKGRSIKSRPFASNNPLLTQNLYQDPEVLEFLVERAQSDPRFKSRLLTAIKKSKSSDTYRLAAANAITILFKSGVQFHFVDLEGVQVPSDYLLEESSEVLQTLESQTAVKLVMALSVLGSNSHLQAYSHHFDPKVKAHSSPLLPTAIDFNGSSTSLPPFPPYVPYSPSAPSLIPFNLFQYTPPAFSAFPSADSSLSTVVGSRSSSCSSSSSTIVGSSLSSSSLSFRDIVGSSSSSYGSSSSTVVRSRLPSCSSSSSTIVGSSLSSSNLSFSAIVESSSSSYGSSSSTVVGPSSFSCGSTVTTSISAPASSKSSLETQPRKSTSVNSPIPYVDPTTGTERFRCAWAGCAKSFSRKGNLKTHYSNHIRNGRFVCPVEECSKVFSRKIDLTRHSIIRHTPGGPHTCGGSETGCKMTFGRRYSKAKHEKECPYFLALGLETERLSIVHKVQKE